MLKSMTNMMKMLQTMAVRTKNLQIVSRVIFPVSIFMVNPKYMRIFFISAAFAMRKLSRFFYGFPSGSIRDRNIFYFLYMKTFQRTKLFSRTFCCWITRITLDANTRLFGSVSAIVVVAFARAMLCGIYSGMNYFKFFLAHSASYYSLGKRPFSRTNSTTIFSFPNAACFYHKVRSTLDAYLLLGYSFFISRISRQRFSKTNSAAKFRPFFLVFSRGIFSRAVMAFKIYIRTHNNIILLEQLII
jgi:hypothetical protein